MATAMIHLLLRGVHASQGQQIEVGGRQVSVLGEPRADRWQCELLAGDLYGVTWVREEDVTDALTMLRRSPQVVDAAGDPKDAGSTRRQKKLP